MGRMIGTAGLELIRKFEGCRLTAYQDSVNVWTIGYGHTGTVDGQAVCRGMTITQEKADALLAEDCRKFADYVDNPAYVPVTAKLNDNQRDALISFAFNCGQKNLKTLCMGRTAEQIGEKITLYNKAGGKVLNGLVRRRAAEKELFMKQAGGAGTKNHGEIRTESEEYSMRTIKTGSKGTAVKIWQIIVGSEPDGIFGKDTLRLTKSWQAKHGLDADGIVGKNTWKAGLESA